MIYLKSCKDYLLTIGTCDSVDGAVAECRRLEIERNDGYAVCGWRGSRLVADADGPVAARERSAYERAELAGDAF